MFRRKHRPFFENKVCDVCKKPAKLFRSIEGKTYLLCDSKKCDLIIRVRHGWANPIIGK